MRDDALIAALQAMKDERKLTLHELLQKLDVQIATVARWLKTKRINRLYAKILKDRLSAL
ncbi:MAG: hypothetical protein NC924_04925 [Candidatus Omnitrophica bacterium]|nr:hypothetical protein [Candidatus Omnitrophota bacterium]